MTTKNKTNSSPPPGVLRPDRSSPLTWDRAGRRTAVGALGPAIPRHAPRTAAATRARAELSGLRVRPRQTARRSRAAEARCRAATTPRGAVPSVSCAGATRTSTAARNATDATGSQSERACALHDRTFPRLHGSTPRRPAWLPSRRPPGSPYRHRGDRHQSDLPTTNHVGLGWTMRPLPPAHAEVSWRRSIRGSRAAPGPDQASARRRMRRGKDSRGVWPC
jgi:hypothetical protein